MEIKFDDIIPLVKSCLVMGMAELQKVHLPDDDKISRSEAIRHLKRNGVQYPTKAIRDFERTGLVHSHKRGNRNEKVFFSLAELQRAIVSINIKIIGYSNSL